MEMMIIVGPSIRQLQPQTTRSNFFTMPLFNEDKYNQIIFMFSQKKKKLIELKDGVLICFKCDCRFQIHRHETKYSLSTEWRKIVPAKAKTQMILEKYALTASFGFPREQTM